MGFLIIVIGEDYLIFYKSYLHSTLFSFFVSAILHQFQVLSGVKLILFKNYENVWVLFILQISVKEKMIGT